MRFKLNELNLFRVTNAVIRRLISIPHKLSWFIYSKSNSDKLKLYENKYKGQTCYLLANGPSLKKMDLSFLENKISFGLNRIYLAYDDLKFTNNFLVSINKLVLSQFSDDINSLKITKFLNWECRNHFDLNMENNLFVYKSFFGKKFGKKMNTSINPAATVTYAALQIIYYMCFQKVIIIGMDHNFITKDKDQPNKTEVVTEEEDINHFHPNYFPKGSKWETPDLTSSEYFYRIAKTVFENDKREIFDCTENGKCEIFKKGYINDHI